MEYRKKPVVIEAFKYGIDYVPDWFMDKVTSNEIITYVGTDIRDSSEYYCEIKTLEGIMRGNYGDYIIKGVKGKIYACKPDIFEMTYELASISSQTEMSNESWEGCDGCTEQDEIMYKNGYVKGYNAAISDLPKGISEKVLFEQATVAMEEHYGYGCETEIDAYFRGAKWMQKQKN